MPRKNKFTTKIGMETAGGVMHYVQLSGPESAVVAVLSLVSLGRDAEGAGITREKLALARHMAQTHLDDLQKARILGGH